MLYTLDDQRRGLVDVNGRLIIWNALRAQKYRLKRKWSPGAVVIYLRASTHKQVQHGDSFETQALAILDRVAAEGLEIDAVYVDPGRSGFRQSMEERTCAKELLHDIGMGLIGTVWVYRRERASRIAWDFLKFWDMCKKRKVSLRLASRDWSQMGNGPAGEMMEHQLAAHAQWESQVKSTLVLDKLVRDFISGRWYTSRPYGYNRNKDGILSVREDEAEVVREAFRLTLHDGLGTPTIASILNERGIPTRTRGTWTRSHVLRILRNRLYIGRLSPQFKDPESVRDIPREVFSESVPRIISDEEFQLAQSAIQHRNRMGSSRDRRQTSAAEVGESRANHDPRFQRSAFLLTGHLWCGVCGGRMGGKRSRRSSSYRCTHTTERSCTAVPVGVGEIDRVIIGACLAEINVAAATRRQELAAERTQATCASLHSEIDSLAAEIEAAEKAKGRLYDLLATQVDQELCDDLSKELTRRARAITTLQERRQKAEQRLHDVTAFEDVAAAEVEALEHWPSEFESGTLERRRVMLCQAIKKVTWHPRSGTVQVAFHTPLLLDTESYDLACYIDESSGVKESVVQLEVPGFLTKRKPAPIGFSRCGPTIRVDPVYAPVIRRMFELLLNHSQAEVAAILTLESPTPDGMGWTVQKVSRCATDPRYCGMARSQKRCLLVTEDDPTVWPPIVGVDLWEAVQSVMKERRLRFVSYSAVERPASEP
ncbi:MAG TPA: recombinase family protein [Symbiobacteriaceae bacterium]|nr:recombinase family protein [Symbiobacteriaceae bacterium]